jgi:tripartite ATP-independent transporter DctM subunit
MVLYAVMANESVGRLFIGGVLPGTLMGICLMIMVYFYSLNRNYPVSPRPSLRGILKALGSVILPLMNPLIILSGMIGGMFTPTEAAAVAVAYAFVLGKFVYRELTWRQVFDDIRDTVKFCGSVYVIVGAALIFSTVLTRERVGDMLINFVKSYSLSPTALVFALALIVLIMGCFVEVTAMFFLLVPVFVPLIDAMGISKVFFGVVFTITAVYGILTPPFGLGLFMITSMTGLSFNRVVKATMPFLIPLILAVILLILFPKIVTFLPDLLMG